MSVLERLNPYLIAARERKATAIATVLHQHAVSSTTIAAATDEWWDEFASALGIHTPSKETIARVIEIVEKLTHPPDVMAPFKDA